MITEQGTVILCHGTDWESALARKYTKDDLTIGTSAVIRRENGIVIHSHLVEFGRPLKELLFAILTTFSVEVAPIVRHDESRAFAPQQIPDPSG